MEGYEAYRNEISRKVQVMEDELFHSDESFILRTSGSHNESKHTDLYQYWT